MSEAIIVALITGVLTLAGTVITVVVTTKRRNADLMSEFRSESQQNDIKLDAKLEKHQAVTDTKIEELTREVRKHNEFAERIPILEEKAKATDRRLAYLEHR